MHILTIPDTPQTIAVGTMQAGRYVCEDNNAAELMLMNQEVAPTIEPFVAIPPVKSGRLLIIGTMGFGDAILITPCLRELKKRNPAREIILATWPAQRQIFFGLPYVDGYVDYPPKLEMLQDFESVLFLERAVEFNLLAKVQHITDRFAQHLGLGSGEWTDNKKPEVALSSDEATWAWKSFPPKEGKRRLAVQVQSGMRCRTYPISQIAGARVGTNGSKKPEPSMLDEMVQQGWEVFLLGQPGEFRVESCPKGVTDMTRMGLTFRQTLAFLTTCNAVLAPDSSMMHAAGTLEVPCVALFGPIAWKLRTAYYKTVFALHGPGECPKAPCFHTHHNGLPLFPPGGPCNKSGICEELAAITPERIRAKIEQVALRDVSATLALPPAKDSAG
jgi:hypothetical protein